MSKNIVSRKHRQIKLKPGQLCTINDVVYRAKKRANGCFGCALNDIVLCPNVVDGRNGFPRLQCSVDNIILKKV